MRTVYADKVLAFLRGEHVRDVFFWLQLEEDALDHLSYKLRKDAKYHEFLQSQDLEAMEADERRKHQKKLYAASLEEENTEALRKVIQMMAREIEQRGRHLEEAVGELQRCTDQLREECATRRFYQQSFLDELENSKSYSEIIDKLLPPDDEVKLKTTMTQNLAFWESALAQIDKTKKLFQRTQKLTTHDRDNQPASSAA